MPAKLSGQGLLQNRQLGSQASACQFGKHFRISRALDQCLKHGAARHHEDVGGHRRQLDPGIFRHLVQALGLTVSAPML